MSLPMIEEDGDLRLKLLEEFVAQEFGRFLEFIDFHEGEMRRQGGISKDWWLEDGKWMEERTAGSRTWNTIAQYAEPKEIQAMEVFKSLRAIATESRARALEEAALAHQLQMLRLREEAQQLRKDIGK